MKDKKKFTGAIIAGVIVMIAVTVGILAYYNSDGVRLKRQLDLGNRYLAELNYEEATVAYEAAIAIEPMSVEAYLGLADAYLGLGDDEQALAALERGYEATGDERLKERIDEMRAAIERERKEIEEAEAAKENARIAERVEEIHSFIYQQTPIGGQDTFAERHLLTYDQIEAFCRPLAEELEMYLQQGYGEQEYIVWNDLAALYCHMSEMEKCLETRSRGFEATGYETLNPKQSHKESENYIIDEYGRAVDTWVYGEGDRLVMWDSTASDGEPTHFEYEYDDLGRISKVHSSTMDPDYGELLFEHSYSYQGDNSVIFTTDYGTWSSTELLTYNEYGEVIERTDWKSTDPQIHRSTD